MITASDLKTFTKSLQTNEATVFREYVQLLILQAIYAHREGRKLFFKGGTAIHFLFKSDRFSEDLDFTSEMSKEATETVVRSVLDNLSKTENLAYRKRDSLAGLTYAVNTEKITVTHPVYVKLDFSFREPVLTPMTSIIETAYPVIFTSFVSHISKEEMFAEKIRAVMTREKGRDIYDLWYLYNLGVTPDHILVKKKLAYYQSVSLTPEQLAARIDAFKEKKLMEDLRPYIKIPQRDRLTEQCWYIKEYLKKKLSGQTL